jgi:hypothetical protein
MFKKMKKKKRRNKQSALGNPGCLWNDKPRKAKIYGESGEESRQVDDDEEE